MSTYGTYGIGQFYILRALSTEPRVPMYRKRVRGRTFMVFQWTDLYSDQRDNGLNLNVRYHEGVPVEFKNPGGKPCLFILDKLLNDAYSSGRVCDLFSKGSHHRNISDILITQNIFHQSKHCRDISLNAKYLILLKKVRDRSPFSRLAQQVYPKISVDLYDSYVDATSRPHGYLVLDLSQDINDLLRFRTEIFPEECPYTLIYASIHYETDTIDLSQLTRLQDGWS